MKLRIDKIKKLKQRLTKLQLMIAYFPDDHPVKIRAEQEALYIFHKLGTLVGLYN